MFSLPSLHPFCSPFKSFPYGLTPFLPFLLLSFLFLPIPFLFLFNFPLPLIGSRFPSLALPSVFLFCQYFPPSSNLLCPSSLFSLCLPSFLIYFLFLPFSLSPTSLCPIPFLPTLPFTPSPLFPFHLSHVLSFFPLPVYFVSLPHLSSPYLFILSHFLIFPFSFFPYHFFPLHSPSLSFFPFPFSLSFTSFLSPSCFLSLFTNNLFSSLSPSFPFSLTFHSSLSSLRLLLSRSFLSPSLLSFPLFLSPLHPRPPPFLFFSLLLLSHVSFFHFFLPLSSSL